MHLSENRTSVRHNQLLSAKVGLHVNVHLRRGHLQRMKQGTHLYFYRKYIVGFGVVFAFIRLVLNLKLIFGLNSFMLHLC